MLKLLAIENDEMSLEGLRAKLQGQFEVHTALGIGEATAEFAAHGFDAVLLEVGASGQQEVITKVKRAAGGAALIVLSPVEDTAFMRQAIRQSASNYLVKGRDDLDGVCLGCQIRIAIKLNVKCQDSDYRLSGLRSLLNWDSARILQAANAAGAIDWAGR